MSIKKAKCCGTCKFWWADPFDDYEAECKLKFKRNVNCCQVCDKHEWNEDE